MAKAIDLSTVSPQRAAWLLARREDKRLEYIRRKNILLQRSKEWQETHKHIAKEISKQWREANPERKAASTRAWYDRNRESCLARAAKAQKELHDSVVKTYFCAPVGLSSKDVPTELVPIIRLSIQIKRELKAKRKST